VGEHGNRRAIADGKEIGSRIENGRGCFEKGIQIFFARNCKALLHHVGGKKVKILLLTIIVVAVAVLLILKGKQPRLNVKPVSGEPSLSADFPPKPKWKPEIPVDLDRIAKAFRYYSDNKRTFAVFENGTCVPVDAGSNQQEQDALAVLDRLFKRHPDFNPHSMDDGNWMISHSDSAYSICFADEVAANWEAIDKNHLDALARDEVLLNVEHEPNVFDKRGKIGLFGRARWFMDCQAPKVVRIERPDSQQPAAQGQSEGPPSDGL